MQKVTIDGTKCTPQDWSYAPASPSAAQRRATSPAQLCIAIQLPEPNDGGSREATAEILSKIVPNGKQMRENVTKKRHAVEKRDPSQKLQNQDRVADAITSSFAPRRSAPVSVIFAAMEREREEEGAME